MLLYHATPVRNDASILRTGLETARAVGAKKVVWLHTRANTPWAVLHVAKRHRCDPRDVVVFEVRVSKKHLRRFRRGLWYCVVDVPPQRLDGEFGFGLIAGRIE